ncbi:MAG: MFS transporter [Paludibacteraceae bacterium]|nr:MFS transporter [Paludibacteraceae bacterium]
MKAVSIVRTKHNARRALLVQYFLMGLVFSSLLSRHPGIIDIYGMSMAQLSLTMFFMSIGSALVMPFYGYLQGKYGCKRLSGMGYVYMSMMPFLAVMPNIIVLYVYCMLYGAMVAITDVSINGNSIIVEHAYKRPIIAMFHALFYVGMCAGASLGILFMSLGVSVFFHLLTISVCALGTFYYIRSFFLKETPSKDNRSGGFRFLLPKGILLLIAFIALFGRIVEGGVSDWSTVYMKSVIEFSENMAPAGLAIYSAFMAFGRFFGDSVRRRYSSPTILLGSCAITALGLIMLVSSLMPWLSIAGLLVSGLGLSCLVPVIYSMAGDQKEVTPAMGLAMVNTVSGTGFLFGPFVIGLIADASSMRVSFLYVLGLVIGMMILTSILRSKKKVEGA